MMRRTSSSPANTATDDPPLHLSRRTGSRRRPIGGSHVDPNETSSLMDLTRLGAVTPTSYQRTIAFRRSFNVVLSAFLSVIATVICYRSIVSSIEIELIRLLFSAIFFILTYHATTSLLKLLFGNILAYAVDKGNKDPVPAEALLPETRIAILYPVYNEDPSRVVGSILATWDQLRVMKGTEDHYEFFVLSDSRPFLKRVCEEKAVFEARCLRPDIKLTYRWRSINSNAKLGNVMDFLRRFSADFKYMVVMDADSLMSGDAIHRMSLLCEGNDRIGIIQTNPVPILRTSIFGRMLQFSCQLYGAPFFKAIKHYHLSDSFYIGHNAIIRVAPFVDYCILPKLEGLPPWGGKPISHDLVEAALMSKHGFDVWFIPEIMGSYEEIPSNIIAFLIRERRWMQGNIQNIRVAWGFGLKHIHRDLLMSGFMAYFSSILWALFVVIMTIMQMGFIGGNGVAIDQIDYEFGTKYLLFFSVTLLFFPRLIGIVHCIASRSFRHHGGLLAVLCSCVLDTLFSALFAPIVMVFIVRFLLMYIKSIPVKWGTQDRDDDQVPWSECLRNFAIPVFCGILLLFMNIPVDLDSLCYDSDILPEVAPRFSLDDRLLWASPMIISLIFSPVICRLTSRGLPSFLTRKLFVTREEVEEPDIIQRMHDHTAYMESQISTLRTEMDALRYAYADPDFIRHHVHYTFTRASRLSEWPRDIAHDPSKFISAFYNRHDYLALCDMLSGGGIAKTAG